MCHKLGILGNRCLGAEEILEVRKGGGEYLKDRGRFESLGVDWIHRCHEHGNESWRSIK